MLVTTHRAPPPSPIAISHPRIPPRARWREALHWVRLAALYTLVLAGLVVVIAPVSPSVEDDLAAARAARSALRYDHALEDYAAARAVDASDPRAYCGAGDVRMLQQEYTDAVAAYRQCTALAPQDAASRIALGDAREAAGDPEGARAAWNTAAALGSPTAQRRLALLDERQARLDEAQREWLLLPSTDPQARAHLGLIALWRGDYQTAQQDFLAARATPNQYAEDITDGGFVIFAARPVTNATGFGLLGYLFLKANLPGFAVRPLQAATTLDPRFGDAHAYLGWALWQTGQTAAARHEIALGVRLNPKLSFAWFAAGEVAAADGNAHAGLADFLRGLEDDAKNPVLWAAVGQMSLALYDYIRGEIAFDNAARVSTDPAYSVLLLRFYVDHAFGIVRDRAQRAAFTALERFPRSEPVRYYAAAVFDLYDYPSLAYYTARDARSLDPTDPAPYVLLGRYEEADGDYVSAALNLRTALALRPDGPFAAQARQLLAPIADISV